jgi:hypothetical protein
MFIAFTLSPALRKKQGVLATVRTCFAVHRDALQGGRHKMRRAKSDLLNYMRGAYD